MLILHVCYVNVREQVVLFNEYLYHIARVNGVNRILSNIVTMKMVDYWCGLAQMIKPFHLLGQLLSG